jgi:hypothetical protein
MKTTGIALIIIGLLLTIFTSFSFFTKKEVADVGRLEINREKKHNVNWPPYVGVAVMVVGGVVLLTSAKRKGV